MQEHHRNASESTITLLLEEFRVRTQAVIAKKHTEFLMSKVMKQQVQDVASVSRKLLADYLSFISDAVNIFHQNAQDRLDATIESETYLFLTQRLNHLQTLIMNEHHNLLVKLKPEFEKLNDESYFEIPELRISYIRILHSIIYCSENNINIILKNYSESIHTKAIENIKRRKRFNNLRSEHDFS